MTTLRDLIWIETRKALRSRMPLLTLGLFLLLPLGVSFLMILVKDPAAAQDAGILSTKADLSGATADWPSFLSFMAQGMASAGIFLFSIVFVWTFGREFVDGTVKDWLAVPVARPLILLAKFIVATTWGMMLAILSLLAGLGLAAWIGLPQGTPEVIVDGSLRTAGTALLVLLAAYPVAWFASMSRGYFVPLGIVFVLIISAQLVAVIGWGAYWPWSIPALVSGAMGAGALEPASVWIVVATAMAGMGVTMGWWQTADQAK